MLSHKINNIILFILLISCYNNLFGAEPTTQITGINFSNITCTSGLIKWTNGNGDRRLLVMKEASACDAGPTDGNLYSSSSFFGNGQDLGGGNYIVYLGAVSLINITGLENNTTYHFAAYEYFDNASTPDFLLSNPAIGSFTTLGVNLNFNIKTYDSCWYKNNYDFINTSTSNFPSTNYKWHFDDGTTSAANSPSKSYNNGGSFNTYLTVFPNYGCKDTFFKNILVIPKPTINIAVNDSTQCLTGNQFNIRNLTIFPPINSLGLVRVWNFGDGTFDNIFQPKKTYTAYNSYIIENYIEMTYNNVLTGCKDTGYIPIEVYPDPSGDIVLSDTINCIGKNTITFDNRTPNTTSYNWEFGDGNTAIGQIVTHSYATPGNYNVIHTASSNYGCSSKDTIKVIASNRRNSNFSGITSPTCQAFTPITINTSDNGGLFSGRGVSNNNYTPDVVGQDTIVYTISDIYCPDTSSLIVDVLSAPIPDLGSDQNLCNQNSYQLSESIAGTYTWSDGSGNNTLDVSKSGYYWIDVDNGQCVGRDSIYVYFGIPPTLPTLQDTFLCKNSALKFKFSNFDTKYLWNDGDKDSQKVITSGGMYSVTATNPCGSSNATFNVNKIDEDCNVLMPNAFSPNGDGRNDVYKPYLLSEDIIVTSFIIFNNDGELIFKGSGDKITWDGKYNGELVQTNQNYFYLLYYFLPIENNNQKGELKGSIFVIQ